MNSTDRNITNHTISNRLELGESELIWDVEYLFNSWVIPVIGSIGVVGNLLNLSVLICRYNKKEVNVLEKSSLLGLIALAQSDMLICLLLTPHAFCNQDQTVFHQATVGMYYQVYGIFFKNVFIKTSTYLTLVVALGRYIAICHPLRARMFIGLKRLKIICALTYVTWFILMMPLAWMYSVHPRTNPLTNETFYYLDLGYFTSNKEFNVTCTYLWGIVGFFIPIIILAFCNVRLIFALKKSRLLRRTLVRSNQSYIGTSSRLNKTLVGLIVMFILLISPSEIFHFITGVIDTMDYQNLKLAVIITNVMQAVNFAFHFVIYCTVNANFKQTLLGIPRRMIQSFKCLVQSDIIDDDLDYRPASASVRKSNKFSTRFSRRSSTTQTPNDNCYISVFDEKI